VADGDLILMSGFGAGMTWASAVWRWSSGPFGDDAGPAAGA
jgi:hypothetical protein